MYIIFSGPFLSQITLDKSMFGGANHTQRPSHHKPPDINNPNTDNLNTSGEDKGKPGLSHPFLGIGPGPMEFGKLAAFRLKLGKTISSLCMKFPLQD